MVDLVAILVKSVDSDLPVFGSILHCVESTGSEDVVKTVMDLTEKIMITE